MRHGFALEARTLTYRVSLEPAGSCEHLVVAGSRFAVSREDAHTLRTSNVHDGTAIVRASDGKPVGHPLLKILRNAFVIVSGIVHEGKPGPGRPLDTILTYEPGRLSVRTDPPISEVVESATYSTATGIRWPVLAPRYASVRSRRILEIDTLRDSLDRTLIILPLLTDPAREIRERIESLISEKPRGAWIEILGMIPSTAAPMAHPDRGKA